MLDSKRNCLDLVYLSRFVLWLLVQDCRLLRPPPSIFCLRVLYKYEQHLKHKYSLSQLEPIPAFFSSLTLAYLRVLSFLLLGSQLRLGLTLL